MRYTNRTSGMPLKPSERMSLCAIVGAKLHSAVSIAFLSRAPRTYLISLINEHMLGTPNKHVHIAQCGVAALLDALRAKVFAELRGKRCHVSAVPRARS